MNRALSPVLLITVVGVLAAAVLLWFFVRTGEHTSATSSGPGAYSRSALGYAGIADVLERVGVKVEKSINSNTAATGGGLVIVGEPNAQDIYSGDTGLKQLVRAPKVLLVLPKWRGSARASLWDDWIEYAEPRFTSDAERVLDLVVQDSLVHRVNKVENWNTNVVKRAPLFKHDVQLIKSATGVTPLIATKDGILLGEIKRDGQRVWVLSDPDVIANHGLGEKGDGNAVLAVEIIKRLQGSESKVVFAEGIHGYGPKPKKPRLAMFEFPFYIVTALGALATVMLLWATLGRFGTPLKPPVPIAAGKQGLVDNVARLMDFAGHHKVMIVRYVEATILDVGRQLHAPKGLVGAELAVWLTKLGRARGASRECIDLFNQAQKLSGDKRSDLSAFVAIARDVYRWKQEIIDGPSKHTRNN